MTRLDEIDVNQKSSTIHMINNLTDNQVLATIHGLDWVEMPTPDAYREMLRFLSAHTNVQNAVRDQSSEETSE